MFIFSYTIRLISLLGVLKQYQEITSTDNALICKLYFVAVEPKKVYATGRGLQAKGVRVKDVADIMVHTKGAGPAEVTGFIVGPTGKIDI